MRGKLTAKKGENRTQNQHVREVSPLVLRFGILPIFSAQMAFKTSSFLWTRAANVFLRDFETLSTGI